MGNLVLKIDRETQEKVEAQYAYRDVDAFSDKYAGNKIDFNTDVSAVQGALRNIFMWNQGEEILFPEFGNNVRKFLYEPLDAVAQGELAKEIQRAIEEGDKRVHIESFGLLRGSSKNDRENSRITFSVTYRVRGNKGEMIKVQDTMTISGDNSKSSSKTVEV